MMNKKKRETVRRWAAREKNEAIRLAQSIWELAEPPFHEVESSRVLADYLTARGFKVTRPFRAVPTAFKAEKGSGKPVIGFLGEYDGLPDCGLQPGTYGHGCGHNLLGVGAAVAAVTTAALIDQAGLAGTVQYWGCPAEELLAGKAYMARDGAFRGMDACLCWHPSAGNSVRSAGGAAMDSLMFDFFGRSAHGSNAQHGRSALDAAILTDVAANYLREHLPENMRLHCVLPCGGQAPNVVPAYARAWYYVRGHDRAQVDMATRRLKRCARGAAMATETRVRCSLQTAIYHRLPNQSLAERVLANMNLMEAPRPTGPDIAQLRKLGIDKRYSTRVSPEIGTQPGRASSDEDTVSWLAPLGGARVACVTEGTHGHHRDYTAQTRLPFAWRGMMRAAEILAATGWDLVADRSLLNAVRSEFETATRGFDFDPLIPKTQRPPQLAMNVAVMEKSR